MSRPRSPGQSRPPPHAREAAPSLNVAHASPTCADRTRVDGRCLGVVSGHPLMRIPHARTHTRLVPRQTEGDEMRPIQNRKIFGAVASIAAVAVVAVSATAPAATRGAKSRSTLHIAMSDGELTVDR